MILWLKPVSWLLNALAKATTMTVRISAGVFVIRETARIRLGTNTKWLRHTDEQVNG